MENVKAFLEAMSYMKASPPIGSSEQGSYPFVTISRQSGAGAYSLAEALLEEMKLESENPLFQGWHMFDAEMCKKILDDAKLSVYFNSLVNEEFHSQIEDIVYQLIGNRPPQDDVYQKVFRAIRLLATFGKVIIIGRGGACLTEDLPLGIQVRLVAPLSRRIDRMKNRLHINEKSARKIIAERDRFRAHLVHYFFGKEIEDPLLYHAVWNTERIPMQEIVQAILEMVRRRERPAGAVLQDTDPLSLHHPVGGGVS